MRPVTVCKVVSVLALLFVFAPVLVHANDDAITPRYSLKQAAEGRDVYATHCAQCHGANLAGSEAGPALSGSGFIDRWVGKPWRKFVSVTVNNMPTSNPGGLSDADYGAVLAFVLYQNGWAPLSIKRSMCLLLSLIRLS